MWFCSKLMHSEHIDVSYFAAGIVAHLASSEAADNGGGLWPATIQCTTRDEILQDLVSSAGYQVDVLMIFYRSVFG